MLIIFFCSVCGVFLLCFCLLKFGFWCVWLGGGGWLKFSVWLNLVLCVEVIVIDVVVISFLEFLGVFCWLIVNDCKVWFSCFMRWLIKLVMVSIWLCDELKKVFVDGVLGGVVVWFELICERNEL